MRTKSVRLVLAVTGLALALGSVAACADDSTASAPITNNPVTTTSLYSAAESAGSASGAESADATPAASNKASDLPETGPNPSTKVPASFPGPSGAPLDNKARAYLAALKQQNVTFMGDSDNSVALTMAKYVCGAKQKGTDPSMVKAFVTASVGPGAKTVDEANVKADKVIRAAEQHYC
ncbi:DUF732 domain-containing protein [Gordonia sp. zg691]|uniref:DUF732 domain-containing protein n=1 Tax=Gordonia jinghuaiqii TaxID=2758710 RepID=A0A7D7QQ15_9ACTN|nr:DUF732 domain-containing protein [Gordonia jinghuaiqii]MBD0863027.1 DUF732 domain-containing protein [Gordonia jinghuaiqii]MCR5978845.1 DUF732 domain-containing protein [Gordonia jinghuaiqii]QMT01806.1 DUF732 domain-containing protein [Gordonia jinghuaiqii]